MEVLAALAVLTAVLAAIGALANGSLRSSRDARQHLALVSTAQTILAGLPSRDAFPFGSSTGVLGEYRWRIDSTPIGTTDRERSAAWAPQGLALLVRSPSGATIEIDTIRLRRNRPQ